MGSAAGDIECILWIDELRRGSPEWLSWALAAPNDSGNLGEPVVIACKALPSVEYPRSCFSYDGETGELRWRERPDVPLKCNRKWAGKLASSTTKRGYITVRINGIAYQSHRVIWKLSYGVDPDGGFDIDHIDGDRSNNRLNNLRLATRQQNAMNSQPYARGLPKGVSVLASGRYSACICVNYTNRHLGLFDTPEEAETVYLAAAERLYGEFAFHNRPTK